MTVPYLATLNPEQRRAVEHSGNQPLLIIAGAGSGKTNTLPQDFAFWSGGDHSGPFCLRDANYAT
jgi:UvrD/REP helicase N-terminal domain